MKNIFGREPAAIAAAIQSTLAVAIAFGWLEFIGLKTQDHIAVVMTVLAAAFAVYLAAVTSETLLAPIVELFKATLALAAIYGFAMSTEKTATVIVAITAIFGAWQRSQASPLSRGTFAYHAPDATRTVTVANGDR